MNYFRRMSDTEKEAFLAYWSKNREKERTSLRPFLVGLSAGLAIGISVILILESGWYERANMVSNSRLSSFVLLFAIILLSLFMAFFYREFRWEMQEQQYLELLAAKRKKEKNESKQP